MSKMSICHITVAHNSDDIRIFEKECLSLANAGYDVHLIAAGRKNNSFVLGLVNIYEVSVKSNPLFRILFGARKVYRKALSVDAELYHFHDIELFIYGIKLIKKGKKVIFDSHEDWIGYMQEITWLPVGFRKIAALVVRRLYRKYLSKFNAVISVSPNIVSSLKNFSSKVFMVSNYPIINDNVHCFSLEEYSERENVLVYSGTVYRDSNLLTITSVINELGSVKYYVVGNSKPEIREQVKRVDVTGKVIFCGFVKRGVVDRFYSEAVAGMAIFNYNEHSGGRVGTLGSNKLFEYMYAGLPVICSNQSLWKERIIDKYNCGIAVQPGNVKQIKSAIEFIVNNKQIAYKMGMAGRQAILKEFNWKTQEEELLKVYKFVLNDEEC